MEQSRLEFWKSFLVREAGFPAPERLARQLEVGLVTEFCECGCNSFGVHVSPEAGVLPLIGPMKGDAAIFQSYFMLKPSAKSLEFVVFADANGNLSYVNIDCNGNSEPVPQHIELDGPPYHLYSSEGLAHEP